MVKKGFTPCCREFLDIVIKVSSGFHVPYEQVQAYLNVAHEQKIDGETGFLVALAAGHQIAAHGATVEEALAFARDGVPDAKVDSRVRTATVADVVEDCDINADVAAMLVDGAQLPDDLAAEVKAMARVAKLPDDLDESEIVRCLHGIKRHKDSLEAVVGVVHESRKDPRFTRARRRLN